MKSNTALFTICATIIVCFYLGLRMWPDEPVPRHVQLNLHERVKIDSSTVCHPDSLAIILRDIVRNEREQNAALDSIANSRSQEERLLDKAQDRFSDTMALMEVILAMGGLVIAGLAYFANRELKRAEERVKEVDKKLIDYNEKIDGVERLTKEMVTKVALADAEVERLQVLRERIEKDIEVKLKQIEIAPFDKEQSEQNKARLEELSKQVEQLKLLGGTPSPQALFARARELRNKKLYEEALNVIAQGLEIEPENSLELFNKAWILDELGQYDEAITYWDKAIVHNPDYYEAHYNKGFSLDELNRHEEAIAAYDAAIKHKPDLHEAHYNKGLSLAALNRREEAIAAFDAALKIKPDKHEAHYNKGVSLAALNRHEEAIAAYDAAIKNKPDMHDAHYNKGISLGKLGRHEEAIAAYYEALKIKPDYASAMYYKACVYSLMKRKPDMLDWLARAIVGNPKYKAQAQTDPDFEFYRDNPDFRKLVGLD